MQPKKDFRQELFLVLYRIYAELSLFFYSGELQGAREMFITTAKCSFAVNFFVPNKAPGKGKRD
ncbi:Conserved hypothetical protein [Clostridium acetobutylicum EA 2018]|nr:Conserved hypothetical protein [Clostridium acetobutylicum EA 2018]AEI32950.1 hypothetical protein SMB_G3640 [Clostridium acetobutylicum DSM 1731]AWV80805.1 hypothetical protein DK921_11965 [Clostridium acetobutylicum]PSM05394.1 hypothetical protein C7T89_11965 [Clostridium sp. NJ4]MBC2393870.1 hypothetical protein [Clostridium acetobutylicum]